jgi:hypothetical protein
MPKANILVVGLYTRIDYLEQFKVSLNYFNFYFLEFISPLEEANNYYSRLGKPIYWPNYKNAFELLEQIKPSKVIFIFIEAFNHVALNAACKTKGIPTFIMDHGILDININYRLEKYLQKQPSPKNLKSKLIFIFLLIQRVKSRIFLNNTLKDLPTNIQNDVMQFIKVRSKLPFENAIKLKPFQSRLPDFYIVFSRKNFEFYQKQNNLIAEQRVFFTGIPMFDHLAHIKPSPIQNNTIVFIDQPLASKELFGWTNEFHSKFTNLILKICELKGYRMYVKLHPLQSIQEKKNWLESGGTNITDEQDLKFLIQSSPIVIGFFSTYLLPLISMQHVTLLTLENHPVGKLDVSKSFTDAGVAYPIYDLEELPWALDHIEKLHQMQLPNKEKFKKDWLYKFDGKSGERLLDILLSDDL